MERELQEEESRKRQRKQEEDSNHMTTTTFKKKKPYKGIRMRKGGKWVAEIREPKKRSRLWLGSYTTDVAAARAHDIAVFYFHGFSSRLNFPDLLPQDEDRLAGGVEMTTALIREIAAEVGARVDAQLTSGDKSPPSSPPAVVPLQHAGDRSNLGEKHDCNHCAAMDFSKRGKIDESVGKLPEEGSTSSYIATTSFKKNPFRGVRERKWGKWVAEIHQPKKRSPLWLGTFKSAVAAARAYDVAVFYFYGSSARLNFPDLLLKEEDRLAGGVDMTIDLIREKAAEVGGRVDAQLTSAAKSPPSSPVRFVNKSNT